MKRGKVYSRRLLIITAMVVIPFSGILYWAAFGTFDGFIRETDVVYSVVSARYGYAKKLKGETEDIVRIAYVPRFTYGYQPNIVTISPQYLQVDEGLPPNTLVWYHKEVDGWTFSGLKWNPKGVKIE